MPPTITKPGEVATRKQVAAGIRAFFRLAKLWELRREEQEALLGHSVRRTTLHAWERQPPTALNDDQLMRLSYLLGTYEGLQRMWRRTPEEADRWIRRELSDAPFFGRSPLAVILDGGLPAMAMVRAYVDAAVGGPPSREESLRWLAPGPALQ